MIKQYRVFWTAKMMAEISVEAESGQSFEDAFQDALSDIDIPEGGNHNSQYVDDSFHIYDVETPGGSPVDKRTGGVLSWLN